MIQLVVNGKYVTMINCILTSNLVPKMPILIKHNTYNTSPPPKLKLVPTN